SVREDFQHGFTVGLGGAVGVIGFPRKLLAEGRMLGSVCRHGRCEYKSFHSIVHRFDQEIVHGSNVDLVYRSRRKDRLPLSSIGREMKDYFYTLGERTNFATSSTIYFEEFAVWMYIYFVSSYLVAHIYVV